MWARLGTEATGPGDSLRLLGPQGRRARRGPGCAGQNRVRTEPQAGGASRRPRGGTSRHHGATAWITVKPPGPSTSSHSQASRRRFLQSLEDTCGPWQKPVIGNYHGDDDTLLPPTPRCPQDQAVRASRATWGPETEARTCTSGHVHVCVFSSFSGTLEVFEKDTEKLKSRYIETHNIMFKYFTYIKKIYVITILNLVEWK